jgi:hypothetical protein
MTDETQLLRARFPLQDQCRCAGLAENTINKQEPEGGTAGRKEGRFCEWRGGEEPLMTGHLGVRGLAHCQTLQWRDAVRAEESP